MPEQRKGIEAQPTNNINTPQVKTKERIKVPLKQSIACKPYSNDQFDSSYNYNIAKRGVPTPIGLYAFNKEPIKGYYYLGNHPQVPQLLTYSYNHQLHNNCLYISYK